jgi:hypothetical protein
LVFNLLKTLNVVSKNSTKTVKKNLTRYAKKSYAYLRLREAKVRNADLPGSGMAGRASALDGEKRSQAPLLFHALIRDNLLWSFEKATVEDIWVAFHAKKMRKNLIDCVIVYNCRKLK